MQLTDFAGRRRRVQLSPDGKRVAFSAGAFADCKAATSRARKKKLDDARPARPAGVVFDRLFIRHWDTWNDGRLNRVFVAPLGGNGGEDHAATLVGADLIGDVPSKPFGDTERVAWSPDGKQLVRQRAHGRRARSRGRPTSTCTSVDADGSGAAKNLTAANKAWDAGPVFSADGKTLYYRAMKRPGFEADRFALMAMDLATGADARDRSASGIAPPTASRCPPTARRSTPPRRTLGQHPLFAVDVASGEVTDVVGDGSVAAFDIAGPTLAFARNTLKSGDQLFAAQRRRRAARARSRRARARCCPT